MKHDPVNKPRHYARGGVEPIQLIEAMGLGHHEACAVKYVARWREKGGVEDLKKAVWYIDRLIAMEEGGERYPALPSREVAE